MKKCLLLTTLFLFLPITIFAEYPDIYWLREKFHNRDFAALQANFEKLLKEYKSNQSLEEIIYDSFDYFKNTNVDFYQKINDWVDTYPDSSIPYVARGIHFTKKGWEARGNGWKKNTPEEKFKKMESFFNLAEADLFKAQSLKPTISIIYHRLIKIHNASGSKIDNSKRYLERGLKIDPLSYRLRSAYLDTITPRWGGSYEKMANFIKTFEQLMSKNPRLAALKGTIDCDKADLLNRSKKYSEALEYATKGLKHGGIFECQRVKAQTLNWLDKKEEAIEALTIAIKMFRYSPSIWKFRGELYSGKKMYSEAIDDFDEAIHLSPTYAQAFYLRGRVFRFQSKYEQALADANKTLDFYPEYFWYLKEKGYCLYKLERYKEAARIQKIAASKKKENASIWYEIALTSYYLKDRELFLKASDNYLKYTDHKNPSNKKWIDWIKKNKANLKPSFWEKIF